MIENRCSSSARGCSLLLSRPRGAEPRPVSPAPCGAGCGSAAQRAAPPGTRGRISFNLSAVITAVRSRPRGPARCAVRATRLRDARLTVSVGPRYVIFLFRVETAVRHRPDAPGDANLRIIENPAPGPALRRRGRPSIERVEIVTTGCIVPRILRRNSINRGRIRNSRTNRTATHRPPDWRLLRAGCARGARGRRNNYENRNRNRTVADRSPNALREAQNAPPEPPMGAHVSRRGFCEENVPSQWRLVYRLFTGVLPVGTSRLPQRHTRHTVEPTLHTSSQAPTLHKHRDRDTHAVRCTRSHTEARTWSDACLSLSGLRVIAHTYPPTPKQETVHTTRICLSALGRS